MNRDHVQTKHEIQAILQSLGLRPQKRYGQNFLIDGNLMRKLVDAADVTQRDTVLEVGGGTGGLSDLLASRAGRLVIVEVATPLGIFLTRRYKELAHVTVHQGDVLESKLSIDSRLVGALRANPPAGGSYLLVANLPYNVATPLLMNLMTGKPDFDRFCFSIQREVADRFLAESNSKDYGPVSIIAQTVCDTQRVARLSPDAFWPAPKVSSSIICMTRKHHPFESSDRLVQFASLLRDAFAHRRKTLRHNLSGYALNNSAVDLSARAQEYSVGKWIEIGQEILG